MLSRKGELLGATIAGQNAAEAIGIWALVIAGKLSLKDVASCTLPGATTAQTLARLNDPSVLCSAGPMMVY